eukprot:m.334012 g.334012  ORF g.334012 m.334012 type:complete len:166 (-) comp16525_c0_seq6:1147-1644(-)
MMGEAYVTLEHCVRQRKNYKGASVHNLIQLLHLNDVGHPLGNVITTMRNAVSEEFGEGGMNSYAKELQDRSHPNFAEALLIHVATRLGMNRKLNQYECLLHHSTKVKATSAKEIERITVVAREFIIDMIEESVNAKDEDLPARTSGAPRRPPRVTLPALSKSKDS